jgi:anti-sigma-K factor RskA
MTPRSRSPRPDHVRFEELAVGFALHALEPEDELVFIEHLQSCQQCRAALDEHATSLAALGDAVPQVEPPPSLLESIRAAVQAEPHQRGPLPVVAAPVPARRRVPEVRIRRSWLLSAAAGVAALVLALGTWSAVLRHDRDSATARGDRLVEAVQALERPGTHTVRLTGFDGQVRAFVVAQGSAMSLVVDGLQPNGRDSVYVLWGQQRSGAVLAVSTFDVPQPGMDVLDGLRLGVPLDDLTTLMVTHEKGRTPPPQTQQPVLAAGQV